MIHRPTYCHLCGGALLNFFKYSNGLVVCSNCEANQPRCQRCNAPTRTLTSVAGYQVCPICAGELPSCARCGQPVAGPTYKITGESGDYCQACISSPACAGCSLPAGPQASHNSNGRVYCPACHAQVVPSEASVQHLFAEIVQMSGQKLGIRSFTAPAVRAVSPVELRQVRRSIPGSAPIPTDHMNLGCYIVQGDFRCIYVEGELPRPLLVSVLAHEYAHAWQDEQHLLGNQALDISEGFAEWVSYQVTSLAGAVRLAQAKLNKANSYGPWLQRFLDAEQRGGRNAVLQLAHTRL